MLDAGRREFRLRGSQPRFRGVHSRPCSVTAGARRDCGLHVVDGAAHIAPPLGCRIPLTAPGRRNVRAARLRARLFRLRRRFRHASFPACAASPRFGLGGSGIRGDDAAARSRRPRLGRASAAALGGFRQADADRQGARRGGAIQNERNAGAGGRLAANSFPPAQTPDHGTSVGIVVIRSDDTRAGHARQLSGAYPGTQGALRPPRMNGESRRWTDLTLRKPHRGRRPDRKRHWLANANWSPRAFPQVAAAV